MEAVPTVKVEAYVTSRQSFILHRVEDKRAYTIDLSQDDIFNYFDVDCATISTGYIPETPHKQTTWEELQGLITHPSTYHAATWAGPHNILWHIKKPPRRIAVYGGLISKWESRKWAMIYDLTTFDTIEALRLISQNKEDVEQLELSDLEEKLPLLDPWEETTQEEPEELQGKHLEYLLRQVVSSTFYDSLNIHYKAGQAFFLIDSVECRLYPRYRQYLVGQPSHVKSSSMSGEAVREPRNLEFIISYGEPINEELAYSGFSFEERFQYHINNVKKLAEQHKGS